MNPYAASIDIVAPRSCRNFWRLMIAVAVLIALPTLATFVFLECERRHPVLFQKYENVTTDAKVEKWQKAIDKELGIAR